MNRRNFILAGVAALSGCAGAYAPRDIGSRAGCCTLLSEAKYADYILGNLAVVEITEATPTFSFPTGKSHFYGIRIPGRLPDNAVLETVCDYEGFWLPSATLFVPQFAFLDKQFNILSTVEPDLYQVHGKLYKAGIVRRSFYGACLAPATSAYVVVYTDTSSLSSKRTQLLNPGGMGASNSLDRANQSYLQIDKRDFALGRVEHLTPNSGFATFDLPRIPIGEVRVKIS